MIDRKISVEKALERIGYWEQMEAMMETQDERDLCKRMQTKYRAAIEAAKKEGAGV